MTMSTSTLFYLSNTDINDTKVIYLMNLSCINVVLR